ncbi:MAG: hypothetical protein ACRD2B_17655, partial [Terriglobia bacterium]
MLNITTETGRTAEEKPRPGKGEKAKRSLKKYLLEKMQVWINSLLEAEREEFSKHLNKVFYAANEAAARTAFFALKDRWGKLFPTAIG